MKTKAVCDATGLTRKTLLFYEEKGLFTPEKRWSNGREYREYTEKNVQELKDIATLRKAWFTVEEIKRMKDTPEETPAIVQGYYEWLLAQKEELDELVTVAENIRQKGVSHPAQLIELLERPVRTLPLPASDVHPRFRYMDELDIRPPHVQVQTDFSEHGTSVRARRYLVADRARQPILRFHDLFDAMGFFDLRAERGMGAVAAKIERDPEWMRRLKAVFMGLAFLAGIAALLFWFGMPGRPHASDPVPASWQRSACYCSLGICAVSGVVRGILEWFTWRRQNRKWQSEENQRQWPGIRD